MRIRIDRLSWIAVLIGAAAVVAWWLMPPAVLVETAPVTTGRFTATVDEDGKRGSASDTSLRRPWPANRPGCTSRLAMP